MLAAICMVLYFVVYFIFLDFLINRTIIFFSKPFETRGVNHCDEVVAPSRYSSSITRSGSQLPSPLLAPLSSS